MSDYIDSIEETATKLFSRTHRCNSPTQIINMIEVFLLEAYADGVTEGEDRDGRKED